jgi:hypothetical protein
VSTATWWVQGPINITLLHPITITITIMAATSAVWRRDFRNFRLLNTTFITLIPKKEGAEHVGDFRPISLIHSFAKLITKILANRLADRLDKLVSNNQGAFRLSVVESEIACATAHLADPEQENDCSAVWGGIRYAPRRYSHPVQATDMGIPLRSPK